MLTGWLEGLVFGLEGIWGTTTPQAVLGGVTPTIMGAGVLVASWLVGTQPPTRRGGLPFLWRLR